MRMFLFALLCILLTVTRSYSISTMDELEALMAGLSDGKDPSSTNEEKVTDTDNQYCGKWSQIRNIF